MLKFLLVALLALTAATTSFAKPDMSENEDDNLGFSNRAATKPSPGSAPAGRPQRLAVLFDCYLTTNVSCRDLEKDFFETFTLVRRASRDSQSSAADVIVRIHVTRLSPDELYEIDFIPNDSELPAMQVKVRLRENLSDTAKIQTLVQKHMIKGVAAINDAREYKIDPSGKLIVTITPHNNAPVPIEKKNPFFATARGVGKVSGGSYTDVEFDGMLKAGYDTPDWLAMAGVWMQYGYVSLTEGGVEQSASNFAVAGWTLLSRSIAKHWSVAVVVRANHDPSSNLNGRAQAHAGIEYELVPFLESSDNTFTVSYLIGGDFQRYMVPNVRNHMQETLATHAVSAYYVKHFNNRLDVSGAVAVATLLTDVRKAAVGGNIQTTLYLTKSLTLNAGGSIGYRNNLLNTPADPAALNPLLPLVGEGSLSRFTFSLNLGVSYTWGNYLRNKKDMRWKMTAVELPVNF